MGTGQKSNTLLVPEASQRMYNFKYEVARDLNIQPPQGDYWGDVPARDCGAIGGHMVRRMIQLAEQQLAGGTTGGMGGGMGGTTGGMGGGMGGTTGGMTGGMGGGMTGGTTGAMVGGMGGGMTGGMTGGAGRSQNPATTPRSLGTGRAR